MTQTGTTQNEAQGRHWLYGANVFLLAVIAVVVVGFIMAMTAQLKAKADLTANKMYSLSEYTRQLLKTVDEKQQKYELVSLYRSADDPEHAQEVSDLLDEYARASKNVTVADLSQVTRDSLEKKVRDRYASELQPYEDAVNQYKKVAQDLEKFAKEEAANAGALAQQPGATEATQATAAQIQGLFATMLPELLSRNKRDINRYTDNTSPNWGTAVDTLKTRMAQVDEQFTVLSNPQQLKDVAPAVAKYLTDSSARYKGMLNEIEEYVGKLNKLQPLKVTDVINSLLPSNVVVLGPTSATVVSDSSIFKPATQADPSSGARGSFTFDGEQAVSSAILGMAEPNKVKVVFVTTSATHPTTAQTEDSWSDMTDRLKTANFDVMEWSPPGPPAGPDQAPQSPTPPAEGKGVVWIVFPPDAPNPQMMMMGMPPPNPQPVIDAVKKHMDEGGQVMFLADAAGTSMMGMSDDKYTFEELVKPFGIDVEAKYTVVHNYPTQSTDHRMYPRIAVTRYEDHEITKPLQALQTIFIAFSSQTGGFVGAPTVVAVDKTLPAGVQAKVLVQSPNDGDTWGTHAFSSTTTFDKTQDYAAPCPLAVAAVKTGAKEGDQRVVVMSSRTVGCNGIMEQIGAQEDENGRAVAYLANPGNGELVLNSVLWLAGYKNMIAVGSKSAAAMRIHSMSATSLEVIRTMLFAGVPLAALALGGVVYLFRRR